MSSKEKLYKWFEMAGGNTDVIMQESLEAVKKNNQHIQTEEQAINFLLDEITARELS